MRIQFERRDELAPRIWEYHFTPERPVDFIPGQYAKFHLLSPLSMDPRGQARTFSFTSLPADPTVRFIVKIPDLHTPYKTALTQLQVGEEMRLEESMGDLVLPKLASVPLVFIAGGIGLASFISMLRQLTEAREEREIYLFYALRNRSEYIYRDLLESYPLALKNVVIAPHRLTADEIKDAVPPSSQFYISGSEHFAEGLRYDLMRLRVPFEQIIFDYFEGYTDL